MRLSPPSYDALDAEQRQVYDVIQAGPRRGVHGPLAIWLHRPGLAGRAQALGEYCRYDTLLEPRLSELAILATARVWSSEYEWWAHKKIAIEAGIAPTVIESVRRREQPDFEHEDEAVVHDFAIELHRDRTVSEATYRRAVAQLGEERTVDLVGLLGYYTLISMTINVFAVSLPAGAVAELGENQSGSE